MFCLSIKMGEGKEVAFGHYCTRFVFAEEKHSEGGDCFFIDGMGAKEYNDGIF